MDGETEQIFLLNPTELQAPVALQKTAATVAEGQVNLENVEDFSTVCRLCATITEYVIPIFSGEGLQNNLPDKIHKHLPIKVTEEDALPRGVCYQCHHTLLAWHELVKCCEQADQALKTRLHQLQQKPTTSTQIHEPARSDNRQIIENSQQKESNFSLHETIKNILVKSLNIDGESLTNMKYVCLKCPGEPSFETVDDFNNHILQAHQTETETIEILEQFLKENTTFEEQLSMDDAENSMESDEEFLALPELSCPFCVSVFSASTRLLHHLNQHSEDNTVNLFICCDESYSDKKDYVKHLQEKHAAPVTSINCKSCGYTGDTIEELQKHIADAHCDNDKPKEKERKKKMSTKNQKCIPVACPECNQMFSNKYRMQIHLKRHTVTERYVCDQCDKSYSNLGNLTVHRRVVHEGILKIHCPVCGEAFPSRATRDAHVLLHTNERPFTCEFCNKSFTTKLTLTRHLEMHLDIRKFACAICPKKFRKSFKPCRNTDTTLDGQIKDEYEIEIDFEADDSGDNANQRVSDDDDEPLSSLATTKKAALYNKFYEALLNFRNHFNNDHKANSNQNSDSSDSELVDEEYNMKDETDQDDLDNYDDLTQSNMRKDRMDQETQLELIQVQTKINGKVYYNCRICGKNLSSTHTYVFHKRIHTGERPCVCHICGKQFRAPNGLQRHLTETHEKVRRHSCRFCPKNFANSQNLKQHMRIHTGERPFVCSHCGKRFTQSGSLHVHLKTHSEQFPHQCAECGAKFRLRSGLTRHKLKHTGERPHTCLHCGKGFRQKHELNSHMLSHSDSKPFTCQLCGAAFRQRRALTHHTKRLHENEQNRDATQRTNKPFAAEVNVEIETKQDSKDTDTINDSEETAQKLPTVTVTENGKKYVECEFCKKSITIASWRRHIRLHQGEKRYSCHTCGLSFSDSGNLARHARALHTMQRPHACPVCPKTFSRNSHLQDHIKSHSEHREFVCDLCGKASKSSAALRMHRRTHGSDHKFQCMECGAGFKRRGELNAHDPPSYPSSPAPATTAPLTACLYCPTEHTSEAYKEHLIQAHTDLLFHCDECDTYVDRKDFILHMSFHVVQYSSAKSKDDPKQQVENENTEADNKSATSERVETEEILDDAIPLTAIIQVENTNIDDGADADNEFSDQSDTEFDFGPLPESVFDAIEDSQDSQLPNKDQTTTSICKDGTVKVYQNPVIKVDIDMIASELKSTENFTEIPPEPDITNRIELSIPPEQNTENHSQQIVPQEKNIFIPENTIVNEIPSEEIQVKKHKRQRTCPICGKVYNASSSYFYHMKSVHNNTRDHECELCGRRFETRAKLHEHKTTHSNIYELECGICGMKFKNKTGLYLHTQTHIGLKTFSCDQCKMSFRWRTHLKRHLKRHSADKSHKCTTCGRGFTIRCDLLRHMRTHNAGKHECNFSAKAFSCDIKLCQVYSYD
ncbi:zinc-finger double domain-containing protein [Phthorimaea operculella]|nr:zinc-finger double domain-containing protein [Phthorimaea operculella]